MNSLGYKILCVIPTLSSLVTIWGCFHIGKMLEMKYVSICAIIALMVGISAAFDGTMNFIQKFGAQRLFGPIITICFASFFLLLTVIVGCSTKYAIYCMATVLVADFIFSLIVPFPPYKDDIEYVLKHNNLRSESYMWEYYLLPMVIEPILYSEYIFKYENIYLFYLGIIIFFSVQGFKKK